MYPHERSLVRHLADKPFAIIGVNSDKDLEQLKKVVEKKNITWRSFWNGPDGTRGPISTEWGVTSWPTTYLIDKDGVIRYKHVRGASLDSAIETLMAEMDIEVKLTGIDHEAEDAEAMNGGNNEPEAKKSEADKPEAKEPKADAAAKQPEAESEKEADADADTEPKDDANKPKEAKEGNEAKEESADGKAENTESKK